MNKLLDKLMTIRRPKAPESRHSPDAALAVPFQRRAAYRHHPGDPGVDPTRFGDWEYNGRCTDFC